MKKIWIGILLSHGLMASPFDDIALSKSQHSFSVDHPNKSTCHLQILTQPHLPTKAYQTLMDQLELKLDRKVEPLRRNFDGIESGVGSEWVFQIEGNLSTRSGASFGEVLKKTEPPIEKLLFFYLPCTLEYDYQNT